MANARRLTGLDAARAILGPEGLYDVQVEGTPGELTDHYDPRSKKLRLSAGVAQQPSVAALAIVAHEIGHALQDHQGYAPLKLRGAIVPAVTVSSWVAPILFFIGLFWARPQLAWVGVLLFGVSAVFALITLPVEFDASTRALRLLQTYNLADGRELQGAKSVLERGRADLRGRAGADAADPALLRVDPGPPPRLSGDRGVRSDSDEVEPERWR